MTTCVVLIIHFTGLFSVMHLIIYSFFSVLILSFFFLIIRRQPGSTRTDTLFPYRTLFRSTLLREQLQGVRQVRLAEDVALGERLAAGQVHLARAGIALHHLALGGEAANHPPVNREAFLRDPDRRRQGFFQRQVPVLLRHVHQRGRQAGDAGRPRPRGGAVAIEVAVLEQVGLLRRRRGRGLARVAEYVLAGDRQSKLLNSRH